MGKKARTPLDVASLVDRMFADVMTEGERSELLGLIQAWEEAHPDVDAARRVTGWIDVAYAFQAQGSGRQSAAPVPPMSQLDPSHP